MDRLQRLLWLTILSPFMVPGLLYAQASVTGVVRDSSGAVLPGVTVDVASPVLIEQVRSAVTDGTGRYRVEELRPGNYALTFRLQGFTPLVREGIQLTGALVTTVNAELRVGTLEETVTVTGGVPLVDVQSTVTQRVLTSTMIEALPTGKVPGRIVALFPGVATTRQDVGGLMGDGPARGDTFVRGVGDARALMNGLSTHTPSGASGASGAMNMAAFVEVTIDTAGVGADRKEGGLQINLIPKDGGNTFSGSNSFAFANDSMQDDNVTQGLRDRGLPAGEGLNRFVDVNPAVGGPVVRNKLWFHTTVRYNRVTTFVPVLFNRNAGNPNVWTYEPDTSRGPAGNDLTIRNSNTRVTWQVRPKLRLGFMVDLLANCDCPRGIITNPPEAAAGSRLTIRPKNQIASDFSAPLTSSYLLEGGVLQHHSISRPPPAGQNPYHTATVPMVGVQEQSTGMSYRGTPGATRGGNFNDTLFGRVSLSRVTGAHALKVGFQYGSGRQNQPQYSIDAPIQYRFNNGVPNRLTMFAFDTNSIFNLDADHAIFVQDRWTLNRWTFTGGLRYGYFHVSFPEQHIGPTLYAPNRNITFPASDGVRWHDLSPRLGLAVDVFGDGRTAVKASLGRYIVSSLDNSADFNTGVGIFTVGSTPVSRLVTSTTRSWNDANRNFVPDCDLLNPPANGECGVMANPNFGSTVAGINYDPDVLRGWGRDRYTWQLSMGVERELVPRVSMDVLYFRAVYGNHLVVDNRSVAPADYDQFSITAPLDPRLPGGGGYVVGPLFDLKPASFGRAADELVTWAKNYGNVKEGWSGVDVNIRAQPLPSLEVRGGTSTGRFRYNNCELLEALPELNPLGMPYCDAKGNFLTQVKMASSYTIPRVDVLLSATLQSLRAPVPGREVGGITANYTATDAVVRPSLGRNLSGGSNVTVNLVPPGTVWADRLNQLDLRVAKVLRFGRTRATVGVDIYNATNSNAVLTVNPAYASWLTPTSILGPRFFKFNVQYNF
jgi:hypothetical protein